MGIETKVFRTGNSAAVRLPKELGFPPGTLVTIQKTQLGLSIRAIEDPDAARRNNQALADDIRAIWAAEGGPPPREERDPDIFPDRPGLY